MTGEANFANETLLSTPDSEIVLVDRTVYDDSFKQDRSWDDFGTTFSGIEGIHQNSIRVRMPALIVAPRVNSKLDPFL